MLQQYGAYSTETRLFTQDFSTKNKILYDCKEYDEKLTYFNVNYRDTRKIYSTYEKILKSHNLNPIYDTTMSINIIVKYFEKFRSLDSENEAVINEAVVLFISIVDFLRTPKNLEKYNQLFIKV